MPLTTVVICHWKGFYRLSCFQAYELFNLCVQLLGLVRKRKCNIIKISPRTANMQMCFEQEANPAADAIELRKLRH